MYAAMRNGATVVRAVGVNFQRYEMYISQTLVLFGRAEREHRNHILALSAGACFLSSYHAC